MNKNSIVIVVVALCCGALWFFLWQQTATPAAIETPVAVAPTWDQSAACITNNGIWNADKNTCFVDEGDISLQIDEAQTPETIKYQTYLESSQAFAPIIEDINNSFAFPYDIVVTFKNCDEANAFYEEETKSLTMCYELMADVDRIYSESWLTGDALESAIFNNTLATLFHELGHGFIDIYQLPITGREEDVADQISTYILLDTYEGGASAVLDAAEEYYANAEKNPVEWEAFADVHTSDLARYYNLVCWVYGSDETQFADLLENTWLTEDRAAWCADEYNKFKTSLDTLLAGYTKTQ